MSANKNKVVTLHPDYPEFPTTKKVSTQAIRCVSKKEAAWGIFMEMLSAVTRMAASWLMKPAKAFRKYRKQGFAWECQS